MTQPKSNVPTFPPLLPPSPRPFGRQKRFVMGRCRERSQKHRDSAMRLSWVARARYVACFKVIGPILPLLLMASREPIMYGHHLPAGGRDRDPNCARKRERERERGIRS